MTVNTNVPQNENPPITELISLYLLCAFKNIRLIDSKSETFLYCGHLTSNVQAMKIIELLPTLCEFVDFLRLPKISKKPRTVWKKHYNLPLFKGWHWKPYPSTHIQSIV